jgi:hypothetical protein
LWRTRTPRSLGHLRSTTRHPQPAQCRFEDKGWHW